jgi:hypothetical protein
MVEVKEYKNSWASNPPDQFKSVITVLEKIARVIDRGVQEFDNGSHALGLKERESSFHSLNGAIHLLGSRNPWPLVST